MKKMKKYGQILMMLLIMLVLSGVSVSAKSATVTENSEFNLGKTNSFALVKPSVTFKISPYKVTATQTSSGAKKTLTWYGHTSVEIYEEGTTKAFAKFVLDKKTQSKKIKLEKGKYYKVKIEITDGITGPKRYEFVDPLDFDHTYEYAKKWFGGSEYHPQVKISKSWFVDSETEEDTMIYGYAVPAQTNHYAGASVLVAEPKLILDKTAAMWTKQTMTLKPVVKNCSDPIKWKSNKPGTASVNSKGTIKAKKSGKVVITATMQGISRKCTITIKNPSIKLSPVSATMNAGTARILKATVNGPNQKVTWSSSNSKIASVDKNGKVVAKKEGKTKITAKANGVKATCTIKVKPTLKLTPASVTLAPKKGYQLKATVKGTSKKVRWSSSNKAAVTVNGKGYITAKKSGTAVITAKVSGITAKCTVTVKDDKDLFPFLGKDYSTLIPNYVAQSEVKSGSYYFGGRYYEAKQTKSGVEFLTKTDERRIRQIHVYKKGYTIKGIAIDTPISRAKDILKSEGYKSQYGPQKESSYVQPTYVDYFKKNNLEIEVEYRYNKVIHVGCCNRDLIP